MKRFLKPGFTHCFMVALVGSQQVLINPTSHYTCIAEGAELYEGTYVDIEIKEPARVAKMPWEPNTCVTQLKNFIGIGKYDILTPYQLYRYLVHGFSVQQTEIV